MAISAGQRLADRYVVQELLGAGGSSKSYLVHTDDGQPFAVKTLHMGQAEDWQSIEMFERQFEALEHLRHPHIPRVYELFSQEVDQVQRQFIVQEFIQGENLKRWLESGRRFDEEGARRLLLELLDVLEYLHAFSPPILHRDIKPSNIILRAHDQAAVLIDFDTARLSAIDASVADGTMIGTAGYVPLEQLSGRPQPASDLYALGMTLIRALSGKDPTDLPVESMRVQFRPFLNVSEPLLYTIERMIEPDVNQRLQDVTQVREALAQGPPADGAMIVAPSTQLAAPGALAQGQEVIAPSSGGFPTMPKKNLTLGHVHGTPELPGHVRIRFEDGVTEDVAENSVVPVTHEGITPITQVYCRGMLAWEVTWVVKVSGRIATIKHSNESFQSNFFNRRVDLSELRQPLRPEDRATQTSTQMTLASIKSDPFGFVFNLVFWSIFLGVGLFIAAAFIR